MRYEERESEENDQKRGIEEDSKEFVFMETVPPRAVTLDSDEPVYMSTVSELKQSDEEEASTSGTAKKEKRKRYRRETMD